MQQKVLGPSSTAAIAADLPPYEALSMLWGAFSALAESHFHLWWLRFEDALALLNEGYESGPPFDLVRWEELLWIAGEQAPPKSSPPLSSVQSPSSTLRKAA
jgi:hypothetical protein